MSSGQTFVILQRETTDGNLMKYLRYITLSGLLLSSILLTGCDDSVPDGVMNEAELTSFLKEAYILEGFYAVETNFRYDSLTPQMVASYDSLLKEHKLTREDFETSISWYTHHPERYERVHKQVIDELDAEM